MKSTDTGNVGRLLVRPGTVLLDDSEAGRSERRTMLFTDPVRELRADSVPEVPTVLRAIDLEVRRGHFAAGYVTYEAAQAWMGTAMRRGAADDSCRAAVPLVWFGIYRHPAPLSAADLDAYFASVPDPAPDDWPALELTTTSDDYLSGVGRVRELIREGDVYQINYTGRFTGEFDGDPVALYAALRERQPVGFGALLQAPGGTVLSASPELFFRRSGRDILTRPMKGTAPRGRTPQEDEALAAWLQSDPKSRAENLMIVDLLRNDLSVVCETGTVDVPALFEVEAYPTLLQMTSTVSGRLRPGATTLDLFRALFPCGSVTGAPKRRAVQRIAELEAAPRGAYCGAIGFVAPGEEAVFNVAIRTAAVSGGRMTFGSGSGIVWDSDAEDELVEARLKTRFISADAAAAGQASIREEHLEAAAHVGSSVFSPATFSLIETMRFDAGTIPWLERHLARLARSAKAFGWNVDLAAIREAVALECERLGRGPHRVRLLVGPAGTESLESLPLTAPDPAAEPPRIGLSSSTVHSGNPFLRHKTTRRDIYDRARREAEERGLSDVLLRNERGEITEGAVHNVFVRHGEMWRTPPLECGVLPGVAREVLIERLGAAEASLTADHIRGADEILLSNAVHADRRAELVEA